jgi:hypothetical protein
LWKILCNETPIMKNIWMKLKRSFNIGWDSFLQMQDC